MRTLRLSFYSLEALVSFAFKSEAVLCCIRVGIENNNDDRTIAWALEHPGCFAYGRDSREAQANFLPAAREYAAWIARHEARLAPAGCDRVQRRRDLRCLLRRSATLIWRSTGKDSSMVESFFRHDWKPLTAEDIEHALKLLAWSRRICYETLNGLSEQKLDETYGGERWSINGILKHIGGAEWWYQERIGHPYPASEDDLPEDPRNAGSSPGIISMPCCRNWKACSRSSGWRASCGARGRFCAAPSGMSAIIPNTSANCSRLSLYAGGEVPRAA